jgi:hypothetical protein
VLLLLAAGRGIPGRTPVRRQAAARRFARLAVDMLGSVAPDPSGAET